MYKGINQDLTPDQLQGGLYYYAKNIVISDHLGKAVNELGNQFITSITPEENKTTFLLGLYSIEDIVVVFSVSKENFDTNFDNSFGDSVIGVFYNDTYTEILGIREFDWAFSTFFPIQATGHKNNKEEFVIAFTDNFNAPRIINIGTKTKFELVATNENETFMYPASKVSSIVVSQIEQGGSLKSGMYFVSYIYEDSQGNSTKGFNVSNGVAITRDTISIGNKDYNGVSAGTATNKSLKIILNDVDTNYKFISFYIIQVIDGVTSVVITEKQPITSNYIIKVFTGNETTYDGTIEEVLIGNAYYTKARTITAHAKALYVGNLETDEEINLQPFVNNIQINPVSTLIDVTNLTDNQKTNGIRGFMHDEVYALYIRFWVKGKPTRAYHLPGRPLLPNEETVVDGQPFYIKNDTSYSGGFSSMGAWENVNEFYPIEGGFPLENGVPVRVRHHKFPSISKCKTTLYGGESDYGKTKLDVLGIEVNFTQVLPIEFDSWEILYAKRENGTTIGTDLLLYSGYREGDVDSIWTTAGNWDLDARQAGSGSWDDIDLRQDYIRLHNFELLYTNTSSLPDYLKVIAKLRKPNLNATFQFQDNGKEGGRISVSGDVHNKTSAVIDYTSNNSSVLWNPSITSSNLTEQLYVENNLVSNDYLNFYGEKTVVSKLETYIPISKDLISTNSPNQSTGDLFAGSGFEETYLISLHYLKTDVYVNFYRQQLVSTGQVNTTSAIIYGGDTFVGEYSFITTASINGNLGNKEEEVGVIIYRNSIAESIYNLGLRNEGNGKAALAYYPVTDVVEFNKGLSLLQPLNVIGYNKDYSSLNIYVGNDIYNPYEVYQNKFPYRIARSELQTNETTNLLWKTWKANNYYEAEKNAGEITNLASFFGRLLIHHFYRLYTTIEKTTLETTNAIIAIGAGDIFRILPESITGEETSYAGSQQTHTPFIFKGGYVFIDSLQGKVFVLTQGIQLQEISNSGMKKFFASYLPTLTSSVKTEKRSFWVKPKIERGEVVLELPLNQDSFVPFVEQFIYSPTTDITYDIKQVIKTYTSYIVTLDLTKEETLLFKAIEYLELILDGNNIITDKIVVDNKYQDNGYALGYDEIFNRLLLSKNTKAGKQLIKKYKPKIKKYNVTVPVVTVTEIPCDNKSIGGYSGGKAGITQYKISNYTRDVPMVIAFDAQNQLDSLEIAVKLPNQTDYNIVATSSMFAEGNFGVTTSPTTISGNTIQPIQGFDINSGLNTNGDSVEDIPFSSYTHVLFDEIRFLDGSAKDAALAANATSADYVGGYNPFYVGGFQPTTPKRYNEALAFLATLGIDLNSSPDAIIPIGDQFVFTDNIPLGSSVLVTIKGASGTLWGLKVLKLTKSTTCTSSTTTYETKEVEVISEEAYYEIKDVCFSNSEYINGSLIKPSCGLLENYYHLGLVTDKNNQLKKLLLQGSLQEKSLEIVYCCPESAPEITAEWSDPLCITEGEAGTPPVLLSFFMNMYNVDYSIADGFGNPNGNTIEKGGVLGTTVNAFFPDFHQGDSLRITYTIAGQPEVIHLCTANYSPDLALPIIFNARLDVLPPFPLPNPNGSYYGYFQIGTLQYLKLENLTSNVTLYGGALDTVSSGGTPSTFTPTGFSYFETLTTDDGDVYTVPYPATAQQIADILGCDIDYATDLFNNRVVLDPQNCFPPNIQRVTQTVHTRGLDKVKNIIVTGQGIHNFNIKPIITGSPLTTYQLDGNDFTLQEIKDSVEFNLEFNTDQTYDIDLTTETYDKLEEEAVYMVEYSRQGTTTYPYPINLELGVQTLSKDHILAFDDTVYVSTITGSGWYADVRVNGDTFTSFPLKTVSAINGKIQTIPIDTNYIIHFYLTEPIIVYISDVPNTFPEQYIAFSDKSTDIKTALYMQGIAFDLEIVNTPNLSYKIADGNILKDDVIWNSLTFKTFTEIRSLFGNGDKTILVQNNTVGFSRHFNALKFKSEYAYLPVPFDYGYEEFYIPRTITELFFTFTASTVTIREDNSTNTGTKTTVTTLVEIQNWFAARLGVNWAILEVSTPLPKTIKLQ